MHDFPLTYQSGLPTRLSKVAQGVRLWRGKFCRHPGFLPCRLCYELGAAAGIWYALLQMYHFMLVQEQSDSI